MVLKLNTKDAIEQADALLKLRREFNNAVPRMPNGSYCKGCGARVAHVSESENFCIPCKQLKDIGRLE